ncbi:M23 family metallopeptidase [Enhygromyxa salina]|uniref:M23 family metallopeptidase n=1 Tax=Enhygromyxa salina TaxID=215803 RepID=UPI000D0337FC|nr:M23 family metallopeptidase [Enhygromyxa salina]
MAGFGCADPELEQLFDGADSHTDDGWATESESESDGDTGADGHTDDGSEETPPPDPPSPPDPAPEQPTPDPQTGGCQFDLVWPTTGTADAQTLVHDAYGPRLLGGNYDWHGGIDLPGRSDDDGFHDPVHAVADGSIYAIGNRPSPNQGALSSYSASAGNVIVLEHEAADLHPGAETLYSLYLHLDTIELDAFSARLADNMDEVTPIDLREYYYLGGAGTTSDNRGHRRSTFKSSGEPITAYPRVRRQDPLAIIGDSGATYEHLHFEIRETSPTSDHARNPFAYLPHLDLTQHSASLSIEGGVVRALVEIPRAGGSMGATTDLSQQLDVDTIALQVRDLQGGVLDELRVDLSKIAQLGDPDQPLLELEGIGLRLAPNDFDSSSSSWQLEIEFLGLGLVGLLPILDEVFALEVTDLCGNRFTTM